MKIARYKSAYETLHQGDVSRIRLIFAKKEILIPETDIIAAWAKYSAIKDAQWLSLPDNDDEIFNAIIDMFLIEEW